MRYYARLAMALHPELEGAFERRDQRSGASRPANASVSRGSAMTTQRSRSRASQPPTAPGIAPLGIRWRSR
jgi:hypothetical protein